jgi:hypothetical protein
LASGLSSAEVAGQFFQPQDWFSEALVGTSVTATAGLTSVRGQHTNRTDFQGDAGGVSDVPILLPVPFQELSGVQYYSPEEQLVELTAALKEQFQRHCFIKIHDQKTQPMRVPFVEPYFIPSKNKRWYEDRLYSRASALPPEVVDRAIAAQENELLKTTKKNKTKKDDPPPWSDFVGRE